MTFVTVIGKILDSVLEEIVVSVMIVSSPHRLPIQVAS